MLRALLTLAVGSVVEAACAQGRPSTTEMTCGQAAALVGRQGAIVLGTGGLSFDRFTTSRQFCHVTETTEPAFVPSRDQPQCFIGYRCRERAPDVRGNE